jgi:hypothetical protein
MGTPKVENSFVKTKGGIEYTAPANRLYHALFALNFFNVDKQGKSATEWFWDPLRAAAFLGDLEGSIDRVVDGS